LNIAKLKNPLYINIKTNLVLDASPNVKKKLSQNILPLANMNTLSAEKPKKRYKPTLTDESNNVIPHRMNSLNKIGGSSPRLSDYSPVLPRVK
jgi:hypothetical protein